MRSVLLSPLFAACLFVSPAPGQNTEWDQATLGKATIYFAVTDRPVATRRGGSPPTPDITAAANDLQEYIRKMTGVEVPLKEVESASAIPANGPAFILGGPARELGAQPPQTEFRMDGYAIEKKGERLLIAGEHDLGTAYGVADLLERQGVRFYMPGPYGEEVPRRKTIEIPGEKIVEKPDWEERFLWPNGGAANKFKQVSPEVPGWYRAWQRRNRLGNSSRTAVGHMWGSVFRSAGLTREEAFAQHPEWFALVNGQRSLRQLNLMNEEVVDLFVNHYRKALSKEPREVSRILSISPDDQVILNEGTDAGRFLVSKDIIFTNLPDATDYLIQFNNRVVRKLNEEYPNVRLAFYIYSNYQNAPTHVEVDKNLIPFIAPLNFSRYHALTDSSKANRTFLANLVERWGGQKVELGWRDYSFLCPDVLMPFTRLHMTRKDVPFLHRNGFRYMSTETVFNWPNLLPEFWLLSRMLWDVEVDQEAALKEFHERFYGPAARPMEAYLNEVVDTYRNLPFSAGYREFVGTSFPKERLKFLREKIEEAGKAVASDEVRLHRVKMVETTLAQAERFMAMRDATNRFDYKEAARIDAEILKAWEDDLAFDGHTNTLFSRDVWHQRFFTRNLRKINEWLEGAEVLHVFADEWSAHFDFTQTGELEGLMNPESRAFELFRLKTYSQCLAEQGWEKFRGHIWYRQEFPTLKAPEGKKLYLVFGGVDRFLKAWVNGQELGEGTGGRDLGPVQLELPEPKPGEKNVLTVRVANTSPTELGVGGIIRPVGIIAK